MEKQNSTAKLTIDAVVPYSFRAEKGDCTICSPPRSYAEHVPEDIFINGAHINNIRTWFSMVDARHGRGFENVSALAMDTPNGVLTERDIVGTLKELWLERGAEYANQYEFSINYWSIIAGNKWKWFNLGNSLDQARIHYDQLVEWFDYRLYTIANLSGLKLDVPKDREQAEALFHTRFARVAEDRYKSLRERLHMLEGRIARAEQELQSLRSGTEFSEETVLKKIFKKESEEAQQPRKPMEKTTPPVPTSR